ncbi:MAG: hypothetical protein ACLFQX_09615 [Candidatus Kapaibacterium sp.]
MAEMNFIGPLKLRSASEKAIMAIFGVLLLILYILFFASLFSRGIDSITVKLFIVDAVMTAIMVVSIRKDIKRQKQAEEESAGTD